MFSRKMKVKPYTPKVYFSHKVYLGHVVQAGPFKGTVEPAEIKAFISTVVSKYLKFCTISESTGKYGDVNELTTVIEVIDDSLSMTEEHMRRIAVAYRAQFAQESVMYTKQVVDTVKFI